MNKMEKIFGFERSSVLKVTGWIVLALVSFFVIANLPIIETMNNNMVTALDEKKSTVTVLATMATATSVVAGNIPGANSVAENLADINDYLIIVFAALWLQKYLIGMAASFTFKILVPIASILLAINQLKPDYQLKQMASKMMVLGLVLFFLVPTSIGVSKHIEQTYDQSATVSQVKSDSQSEESSNQDEGIGGFLAGLVDKAKTTVTSSIEDVKKILSDTVDAVAVLIITTCVIPILVFLLFIWVINLILGLQLPIFVPKVNISRRLKRQHTHES
ncbi:hypothetical protein ACVR05_07810 [Streptococcus caprae]|uniref:Beta-carotene 15,15'-monooxygenase n=1 Tax=Streptococcus caprae TaxID=1640501 RepID=A0ABV8CU55_9STRE